MVRTVGASGLLCLAACGGSERAAWQATVKAASTDLQVMALERALSGAGGARSAVVVAEEACAESGRIVKCDDGSVEFEDCVMSFGEEMDGAIRVTEGNPRIFAYDQLTGKKGGYDFTLNGGYTTETVEGLTTTVANITHTGFDDGLPFTAVSSGSFTRGTDDRISGHLVYNMMKQDRDPSMVGCAFTNAEFPVDLEAFTDYEAWSAAYDAAMRKVCDFSTKAVVRGMHRHDGDPEPIHFIVMNEPFDPSNRVGPGGTRTFQVEDPALGASVSVGIGRGGQLFTTYSCYVESHNDVIEAVYDDGLGLDAYSFTCTNKTERGED